jgi:hypothetical protein
VRFIWVGAASDRTSQGFFAAEIARYGHSHGDLLETMTTNKNGLEPIEPTTARDIYLDHKQTECAEATVYNHRFRLKPFFE